MAQYAAPYVQTPLFLINSAVDVWALENIARIGCVSCADGPWPPEHCTEKELAAISQ